MQIAKLYGITDPNLLSTDTLVDSVREAILGGASTIQYRDKINDFETKLQLALKLAQLCRDHSAQLIINDDVKVAQLSQAQGVHLGQEDENLADARVALGPQACIGVSCYDSLALAETAQAQGADYVAFGRFFSSNTKPNARQAPLALIKQAKQSLSIPIVAIGGIDCSNAKQVFAAGADSVAVCHALFSAKDIRARAQAFFACA